MSDMFSRVESMRKQAADRDAENAAVRQKQAAEHRRKMPTVSSWVDEAREVFGADNVKVVFASEGGVTLGQRQPAGVPCVVGVWPWLKPKEAK